MLPFMLALSLTADAGLGQKAAPSPDRLVRVKTAIEFAPDAAAGERKITRTDLLIDRINFGIQYQRPERNKGGRADPDLSRFAGCYFHPDGPAGIALKKLDWFPGKPNTYAADARLPAALVAQAGSGPGSSLAALWSEPPYAVLGMDAGSLAGFARPCQTVHFIERVPKVVKLSVPPPGTPPAFTFIQDARARGAWIEVDGAEPRAGLEKKNVRRFYHLMFIQPHKDGERTIQKELFTKEGMARCMDALVEDGILCYHTSSRYFDFPKLIADAADMLGYAMLCGRDEGSDRAGGGLSHWSSEWVMVARRPEHLKHLKAPPGYKPRYTPAYWSADPPPGRYRWTDDGPKSMKGMVRSDPQIGSMASAMWEIQDALERLGLGSPRTAELVRAVSDLVRRYGDLVAQGSDY